MLADGEAASVLQALPEPALVIETSGRIVFANGVARSRLAVGADAAQDLIQLSPHPAAATSLRTYLARCSGSRSLLIGAVELRDIQGQISRFRSLGCLLQPARKGVPARILLRLAEGGDPRFSVLAQQIRELNEEIRERRRTQAPLEEALRDRELLLQELHHRVKNNIQMLAGMLYAAGREAAGRDAASVLAEAFQRLTAVGSVHQILYGSGSLRGLRADEFVASVGGSIMQALGERDRLTFTAEPIELSNDAAAPLALILNELLTNAVKYGTLPDGKPSRVHVSLSQPSDDAIELSVTDDGPGFDPVGLSARRTSGLGLVRGLARQLGGSFSVGRSQTGGAQCTLRLRQG